jgi:hypothetical protein
MNYKLLILICLYISYGNANDPKFVIGGRPTAGAWSNILTDLVLIEYAINNNLTPVIYWDKECLYWERNGYNGIKGSYNNAWEYYFEPVSPLKYERGDAIYRSYHAPDGTYIPWITPEAYTQPYRDRYHSIVQQYVRLKPIVQYKIDSFYNNHDMDTIPTIGIHLRGTDKPNEVKAVDVRTILNKANELSTELGPNCQFFIATDDESLLKQAKKRLNRRIIYCNSTRLYRSINGMPVHINQRKNPARLGEEVLIETYLLSRCTILIHTISNVSIGAAFLNPQLKCILMTAP